MEFAKELIDKHELSPETVTAIQGVIKTHYDSHIESLEKTWDGKANEGAQSIVDDIISKTQKETGFTLERNQGEKNAPFLLRYTAAYLTGQKSELETSKLNYDNKLKDFNGDESLKTDYEKLKGNYDALQKKEADFDTLSSAGFEEKYKELLTESDAMREDIAFGTAKPAFDKDVDIRISNHEWGKFIEDTKKKHSIVVVDGVGMAVDKTNPNKIFPLTDLVKGNDELTKLVSGRSQGSLDGKETDFTDVKDVPFKVPVGADRTVLAKLVQEQLTKDGITPTHPEHSEKFQALYDKAKAGQQTA
jgi:hypothetical protein